MSKARDIADIVGGGFAIPSGSLGNAIPADGSITTAKLADGAVHTAKIADDAIHSSKIADDAVVSAAIADDAITSAAIADDAVISAAIADSAVDNARISGMASSKLSGALPAIDGSALTGVGGTTPAFCVTRNSDQTSTAGIATLVQWNAEIYDSDGKFANNRFTPTEAGYYYLFAQVNNNNLYNQAALNIWIRKNGSNIMRGAVAGNNSTSNRDYTINCSIINVADSDDYFEVFAEQQIGNGQMIASADRCVFLGYKVG